MRNRAKCKLCEDIIESDHVNDYVTCGCGEISVDGGTQYCRCSARDWSNFIRVDDEDNEVIPKIIDKTSKEEENKQVKKWVEDEVLTAYEISKKRKQLALDALDEMIKKIEELPQVAWTTAITHYDYYSLLLLMSALFRTDDCNDES